MSMGTSIQPGARSGRRFVHLAAAVAGITARSAAVAQTPIDRPPLETAPRTPPVQSYYQTWLGVTVTGVVHGPLLAFADLAGGFYPDMHPAALAVRPAVGVQLPLGFSAFAGYSYSSFWDEHHQRGEEHTLFQQIGYLAPFSPVLLSGRIRGEERVRSGSDVGVRLRALVQVEVPLWRRSPLEAVVSNEVFLGLNQPAAWQPELLDLDITYAGLAWLPDPHLRADAGYMIMLVPRPQETSAVHCLSLGATVTW